MTVREFFIDHVKQTDLKGWIIAALTDEYIVDEWPINEDELCKKEDKVLEIRIFNAEGEYRLSRSDIGRDFSFREINDKEDGRDTYDEWQFLDIDETKGKNANGEVTSTGGGTYKLPLDNIKDAKVLIRYYLGKYEETGQARVEDWRVVEFKGGE